MHIQESPSPREPRPDSAPELAHPRSSLLAALLEARLAADRFGGPEPAPLPAGVERDLRPRLPRVDRAALMLYATRKAVDSYPLLFTTLALAHPN